MNSTDTTPKKALRLISRDDLLELIETLRENDQNRHWPSIKVLQAASLQKHEVSIGSDRARILLHEAKMGALPEAERSEGSQMFGEQVLAQAARAARIRRRQARLLADGATPERADDVRHLLTQMHTRTLREGTAAAASIETMVAQFEATDRRRMALLQDQPEQVTEPEAEATPDTKPAAPDITPDLYTLRDDPRQTDIEAAIALTAPDITPDMTQPGRVAKAKQGNPTTAQTPAHSFITPDEKPDTTPDTTPDANRQLLDLLPP